MKAAKKICSKSLAVLLAIAVVLSAFSLSLSVFATDYEINRAANDPSTSNIEDQFPLTENEDGKVSVDKTVLYGKDNYNAFTDYAKDDFSVTLSALGQSYTTVETVESVVPSERKVHADVVFVLDLSRSMIIYNVADSSTTRAEATINALNNAIKQLLQNDPETRIGIVSFGNKYYGSDGVYLPLDKYTLSNGQTNFFNFGGKVKLAYVPDADNAVDPFDMPTSSNSYKYAYPTRGTTSTSNSTGYLRYRISSSGQVLRYNASSSSSTTLSSSLADGSYVIDSANGYAIYRSGSKIYVVSNYTEETGDVTINKTISNTVTVSSSGWGSSTTTVATINGVKYTAKSSGNGGWGGSSSSGDMTIYADSTQILTLNSNNGTDNYNGITFKYNSSTSLTYSYDTKETITGTHLKYKTEAVTETSTNMISTNGCLVNSKGEYVDVTSYTIDWDGTYTQAGLQAAKDMFLNVNDGEEEKRVPAVVLLSDGIPTYGTSQYDNVGASELGDGTVTDSTSENRINKLGYYTVRTAMSTKSAVNAHYTSQRALFYSIGIGVTYLFGQTVLNPSEANLAASKNNTELNETQAGSIATPKGLYTLLSNNLTTEEMSYVDYADWAIAGDLSTGDLEEAFRKIVTNITDIPRPVEKPQETVVLPGETLNKDAMVVFTDVIGYKMEMTEEPVLRYADKNYIPTSHTTVTNDDGSTVVSYIYNYSVQEQSTGRLGNLSDITVNVITEADGKQIVKWYIPATLLPVIYPDINTIPTSYRNTSPIRLIYKVHLSDSAIGGTYYTNSTDEPATAEFTPTVGNPYYYNNYEDSDGTKHSVIDYKGETTAKTQNTTNTLKNSNESTIDADGKVTVTLGNNGVIELKYIDVTVTKVWKDNNDAGSFRPDSIKLTLYRNGNVYISDFEVGADDCTVTKDSSGNDVWSYTFKGLPYKDGDTYTVTESAVEFYDTTYSSDTLTVTNTLTAKINPDAVVLDYGKTISSSPLDNDNGDFVIDGLTAGEPQKGVNTQDSVKLTYGTATVDGDNVIYTPTKYMSSIDRVHYYVSAKSNPIPILLQSSAQPCPLSQQLRYTMRTTSEEKRATEDCTSSTRATGTQRAMTAAKSAE